MTHLHHLTITTGHNARSLRSDIEPQALASTADLLAAALAQGRAPLPVQPAGCELQATAQGKCLVCTVWHDGVPLATFGVAAHSRCGAGLWRMLASGAQTTAEGARTLNPDRAPQEPWCAARLEAGIVLVADAAAWLGDLERCVAWAWLDMLEDARAAG